MKRILIVDDYLPFLEEMRDTLLHSDLIVETVESSSEALSRLEGGKFDLVITDLLLDGRTAGSGFTVVEAAKNTGYSEVIVVTGFGRPEFCVRSFDLGAFDYIERGSPGSDFRHMLMRKIHIALDYGEAKRIVRAEGGGDA